MRQATDGALGEWHRFAGPGYRPFHALSLSSAVVFALAGDALTIPLLLAWGAHPALATVIGILPTAGSAAQLAVPRLMRRFDGNLRGLTIAILAVGETRGIWLAGVTLVAAAGVVPLGAGIAGVALIMSFSGAAQAIGATNLQAWYGAILPEGERRFVAPRVTGISQGLGAVLLFPAALLIDAWAPTIGTGVYALIFAAGGAASLVELDAIRRLPSPGRVRVARPGTNPPPGPALGRFLRIILVSAFGAGFGPYLSIYAISVLGAPAGFAIVLSALSALAALLASTAAGGLVGHGSSSRLLRASFLLRGGSMLLGLAAFPGNPLAGIVLCSVAVIVSAGAATGTIAANERLLRLAGMPALIDAQGRYVAANAGGGTAGQLLNAAILAVTPVGFAPFALLFLVSGLVRLVTAWRVEVSESWSTSTAVWHADDLGTGGPR